MQAANVWHGTPPSLMSLIWAAIARGSSRWACTVARAMRFMQSKALTANAPCGSPVAPVEATGETPVMRSRTSGGRDGISCGGGGRRPRVRRPAGGGVTDGGDHPGRLGGVAEHDDHAGVAARDLRGFVLQDV